MSDGPDPNMRPPLLRSTSSRLGSFRDSVRSRDLRAALGALKQKLDDARVSGGTTVKDWAGVVMDQQYRRRSPKSIVEHVHVFPGWAARRLAHPNTQDPRCILEVVVSGYAVSHAGPTHRSRAERTFMRLAKSFASLPKLVAEELSIQRPSDDKAPESDEQETVRQLEELLRTGSDTASESSSNSSRSSLDMSRPSSPLNEAEQQHLTLTERLQPFWSRIIPNRNIRLSVHTCPAIKGLDLQRREQIAISRSPLYVAYVQTTPQGSFDATLTIPWDHIERDTVAISIALGDENVEHDMFVSAELLPGSQDASTTVTHEPTVSRVNVWDAQIRVISDIDDTIKMSNVLGGARTVFRNVFVRRLEDLVIQGMGDWYMSMWRRGVRFHYVSNGPFQLLPVISNFLEVSQLPMGSIKLRSYAGRSLFNGFLSAPATRKRDSVMKILDYFGEAQFFLVGDSGEQDLELYAEIARERPNQILAIFIRDVGGANTLPLEDPTGSSGVLFAPTPRYFPGRFLPKRTQSSPVYPFNTSSRQPSPAQSVSSLPPVSSADAVAEGDDNGRRPSLPRRISAPVISTFNRPYPSTSARILQRIPSESEPQLASSPLPLSESPTSATQYFPNSFAEEPVSQSQSGSSSDSTLPPPERKRNELQMRVNRARAVVPGRVKLRIFRDPTECVEANDVLDDVYSRKQTH